MYEIGVWGKNKKLAHLTNEVSKPLLRLLVLPCQIDTNKQYRCKKKRQSQISKCPCKEKANQNACNDSSHNK